MVSTKVRYSGIGMRTYRAYRAKHIVSKVLQTLFILLILTFFLFPIYWLTITSLKSFVEIFSIPPRLISFEPTLVGWRLAFTTRPTTLWIGNSLIIAVGGTILSLALGVPAGYAFARLRFRGKPILWSGTLLVQALPPIVLIIPMRVLMQRLGLLGTHLGVIFYNSVFNAVFVAWIMSGYFTSIPKDMEEMSLVDGCSRIGAFCRIALPLSKPGLVTAGLFSFIFTWNDFLGALTLTNSRTATLPIGIMSGAGQLTVQWNVLAATSIIAILPVLALSLSLQRYYVTGLTLGAMK